MLSSAFPVSTASRTGPPRDYEHQAANIRLLLQTLLDVQPAGPEALVKNWKAEVMSLAVSKLILIKASTALMILQGTAFALLREASKAGKRFLVPSLVLSSTIEYSTARGVLEAFNPERVRKDDRHVFDSPWYQHGVPSRPATPDVDAKHLQNTRGV
jgi:hypothetical protein